MADTTMMRRPALCVFGRDRRDAREKPLAAPNDALKSTAGERFMVEEISAPAIHQDKYRFLVNFGRDIAKTVADEPAPLGDGGGPSPSQFLAAAIAKRLSASLLCAHRKFKEDLGHLTATAICENARNETGRLSVTGMEVTITLGVAPESLGHRALARFEDFRTVSQRLRTGTPFIERE